MQLFFIVQIVQKIDRTDTKTQGWARAHANTRFLKHWQAFVLHCLNNVQIKTTVQLCFAMFKFCLTKYLTLFKYWLALV